MIIREFKSLILIPLFLSISYAQTPEWLRSSDGKWRIPSNTLNLQEESDGEGANQRFGLVDKSTPLRIWFDRFENIGLLGFRKKFTKGDVPLEYKIKNPKSSVFSSKKYREHNIVIASNSKNRYDLCLLEINNDVIAIGAWGLNNKSHKQRIDIVMKIADIFIDNKVQTTP